MVQALFIILAVALNVMPASAFEAETVFQTITAALFTDESYSQCFLSETEITLTGEMPAGASAKGYPVSCEIEGMKVIAAYDLTIFESDGKTVFQPDRQTVHVTFSMPELADTASDDIAVFHIDGDGNRTEIADVSADSEQVSFEAESFSVYVISEHEGEEAVVPRVEFHFLSDECARPDENENYYYAAKYQFYNKANVLQTSQILRDGETLELIQDPPNHVEDGERSYFYGWYVIAEDSAATTDETVYYSWTEDPAKIAFEQPVSVSYNAEDQTVTCSLGEFTGTLPADADGCAHVYLAPLYSDYYFINFCNREDDNNTTLSLITSKLIAFGSDGIAQCRIGNISAPSPDIKHKVFVGWKRELPPSAEYDVNDPNIYIDSESNTVYYYYITLDTDGNEINEPSDKTGYFIDCRLEESDENNNINLYPIFAEARWINFYHETGCTYVGSKYILTNDEGAGTSFTSFPVSSRVGYDFAGWFTEPEGGIRITDENGNLVDNLALTSEMYQIENGVMTAYKLPDESANSEITLYPHWEISENTSYTIIVWKQSIHDDVNNPDEKTYDYYKSVKVTNASSNTTIEAIKATNTYRTLYNEQITGFYVESDPKVTILGETGFATDSVIRSDGKTIINIYFDRTVQTLTFKVYGHYARATNDDYEVLFKLENGQYIPLTKKVIGYNVIWTPQYTYNGATNNNGTQYGLVNGEYLQLTRTGNGSQRNWTLPNGVQYTGTRYTRANNTAAYTGTLYIKNTDGSYSVISAADAENSNEAIYGTDTRGGHIQLNMTREEICEWYDTSGGSEVEYTGTKYYIATGGTGNGWRDYMVFRGLYGQTLSDWGYVWPTGYNWHESYSGSAGSGTRTTFLDAFIVPEVGAGSQHDEKDFYGSTTSSGTTINFYKETLTPDVYELANTVIATANGTFSITDKYNGFYAYKYKLGNGNDVFLGGKNSSGVYTQVTLSNTLNIYFKRTQTALTFEPNYPTSDDPDLSFDGIRYQDDPTAASEHMAAAEIVELIYGDSISDYAEGGSEYRDLASDAPDNYTFAGWFKDTTGDTPYDFSKPIMADSVAYAKWEPVKFRIQIDPNGAEIDHINHAVSDYRTVIYGEGNFPEDSEPITPFRPGSTYDTSKATYFDNSYHQAISEYSLTPPQYITISDEYARELPEDQVFYYMNMQYIASIDKQKIPSDLRNALYLTESELRDYYDHFYVPLIQAYKIANPEEYGALQIVSFGVWKQNYVSSEKYTHIADVTSGEYLFEGWFEVFEDGSVAEMPFDFATLIDSPHKLRALWKLDGGYMIVYTPINTTAANDIINGDLEAWQDPGDSRKNYADHAETTILRQPDNITLNNELTRDYVFRGWQIVGVRESNGNPEFYALEPGVFYQPGEKFIVQAKYADKMNTIHFQAAYEYIASSYRRPDTSILVLDANGGHLTPLDSTEQLDDELELDWIDWYGSDAIGTIYAKLKNDEPATQYDQLHFDTMQSNAAIHLYQYATGSEYDPGGEDKPPGGNYFAHDNGYMLLGFDDEPNEGDFIADYTADSVISVQRKDNTTLYAVWEPTVYLNFDNTTDKDVTFELEAQDTHTLYIVNQAISPYDRVKLEDLSRITVPAGQTLRLAIPYGEDKEITINGINQLGTGKILITESYLPDETEPHLTPLSTDNGQSFIYSERLIKDPEGVTIVFSAADSDYVLILDDPENTGRNTGMHEFDFQQDDLDQSFTLEETRSSTGYIFAGWSNTPGASEPDYAVTDSISYSFEPLSELFDEQYVEIDPESHAKIRKLYAVWKIHNDATIFYVYKEAPLPGDPEKEYSFTVDLYAPYTYGTNNSGRGLVSGTGTFLLKNGEYLRIENDVVRNTSPHIRLIVQHFSADGTEIGDSVIITSELVSAANAGITLINTEYKVTVTEQEYTNFDTAISILALANAADYPAEISGSREFYWSDPNAGGTVLYTNTRKTADVTLEKLLVDPENTEIGRIFRFRAELIDTDSDYAYTLSGNDSDIALINGERYTIKDLPANATLRITELDALDHSVSAISENGSADLNNDPRIFEFVIPEGGETIIYTNELRTVNVVLHSIDEHGDPFADATYQVSGGTDVYPDTTTGIFYRKEPMYLGSFTVDQIWCDPLYQQISQIINFSIIGTEDMTVNSGTAITADITNDRYSAEFDSDTQTWHIYIINYEKQIAPTGVRQTPAKAVALTAAFSIMFCTAFVYTNRRRKKGGEAI